MQSLHARAVWFGPGLCACGSTIALSAVLLLTAWQAWCRHVIPTLQDQAYVPPMQAGEQDELPPLLKALRNVPDLMLAHKE